MKLKKFLILPLVFVSLTLALNSCSQMYDNTQEVSLEDAGQFMDYEYGTVVDVSYVKIKDTGAGALVGAVIGGVLGSFIGEGKAKTLATILGGLGGAYVGYKADTANAEQLLIELEDGRKAAIVVRGTEFDPGDKVRIIFRNGKIVRVEKVSRR